MKITFVETDDSLLNVHGVGEKQFEKLESLGLETVNDALYHLPSSYSDVTVQPLTQNLHNETATVFGVVETEPAVVYFHGGKNRLTVFMTIDNIYVKVIFFNQPFLKQLLKKGSVINITGKIDIHKLEIKGQSAFKDNDETFRVRYPLKGELHNKTFQNIIRKIFNEFHITLDLPEDIKEKYRLMRISEVLYELHFPTDNEKLREARRTFKFLELYEFQLRILRQRNITRVREDVNIVDYNNEALKAFIQTLPFELTPDQKESTNEICRDLKDNVAMHRLLQGDVGSGKTVVSGIAAYALKTIGAQTALMVPTEVLANQHYDSFAEIFKEKLNIALLTGNTKEKKRKVIYKALSEGAIDLIIGTHALIEDDVVFKDLSLTIVDEQHRFGVNQRNRLRDKALRKNTLYMTATPIPRTLAITTYGDMDVSTIRTMPKGRKPVITTWSPFRDIENVILKLKSEYHKGHNVYVVVPLIEESETLELENVHKIYDFFVERFGVDNVALVHGQLKSEEKEARMQAFESLEKRILISTTVIEVGINVPNATFMLIYNADRYGLSTLHQLRGRVGRSDKESYCVLLSDPKTENAKMRLKIMTETTDGFELSQQDLELRGPGDYFGLRQSGLPQFKVANLVEDYRILEHARKSVITRFTKGEF